MGVRIGDRYLIALRHLGDAIIGLTDNRHLTTDPACARYRAPRQRSRLDRASRGIDCVPCMIHRAFHGDCDAA